MLDELLGKVKSNGYNLDKNCDGSRYCSKCNSVFTLS